MKRKKRAWMMLGGGGSLRVGVVGIGVMGRNHVRVLREIKNVDLVGVADFNEEAAAATSVGTATKSFSDHRRLFDKGLDAVVVAVPTAHHYRVVVDALSRGIHVLVEKPIASTVSQATEMIDLADAKKLTLMVGHIERFNPAVQTVKSAIANEKLISISITRVGPFPPRLPDVGIVTDLGVHDIDLIRFLTNSEIAEFQPQTQRTRGLHEDIAFLQFRTENGILAHVNTNWLTPYKERTIQLSGRTQFIHCDLLVRSVVVYSDYKEDGSFVTRHLSVPQVEPLRAELAAFFTAVAEGSPPPVTGRDGATSLKLALACLGQA